MKGHTPEPWEARPDNGRRGAAISIFGPGEYICQTSGRCKANSQRIVACVNACKGINPEAVPLLFEAMLEVVKHYEVRRAMIERLGAKVLFKKMEEAVHIALTEPEENK